MARAKGKRAPAADGLCGGSTQRAWRAVARLEHDVVVQVRAEVVHLVPKQVAPAQLRHQNLPPDAPGSLPAAA